MTEAWVRRCDCECFICSEGIGHCDERPDCGSAPVGLEPVEPPNCEDCGEHHEGYGGCPLAGAEGTVPE